MQLLEDWPILVVYDEPAESNTLVLIELSLIADLEEDRSELKGALKYHRHGVPARPHRANENLALLAGGFGLSGHLGADGRAIPDFLR